MRLNKRSKPIAERYNGDKSKLRIDTSPEHAASQFLVIFPWDRSVTRHTLTAYAFPASYDKNGDGKAYFKSRYENLFGNVLQNSIKRSVREKGLFPAGFQLSLTL